MTGIGNKNPNFKFIDLFAGIGGMRLAFEANGGQCVYTAEWNKYAKVTYEVFFSNDDEHRFVADINEGFVGKEEDDSVSGLVLKPWSVDDDTTVPEHDVLLAGFPCQPFSLAGVSKKNSLGRSHGFDDPTQGTLFFNIKEILLKRQPSAFLLENVKNLKSHDKGQTFRVICDSLTQAGYAFFSKIIDASQVVPQHRERIFIVGYNAVKFGIQAGHHEDDEVFWGSVQHALMEQKYAIQVRFCDDSQSNWPCVGPILEPDPEPKYTLTSGLWSYLQGYKAKHQAAGNGFGYGLVDAKSVRTRTISARYYKDGSEALVEHTPRPRRLTPLECLRLQGFPEELEQWFDGRQQQPVSDTQAYRQFGNSVCVPVVQAIAAVMSRLLKDEGKGVAKLFP